jgi:hypothetical protein
MTRSSRSVRLDALLDDGQTPRAGGVADWSEHERGSDFEQALPVADVLAPDRRFRVVHVLAERRAGRASL